MPTATQESTQKDSTILLRKLSQTLGRYLKDSIQSQDRPLTIPNTVPIASDSNRTWEQILLEDSDFCCMVSRYPQGISELDRSAVFALVL